MLLKCFFGRKTLKQEPHSFMVSALKMRECASEIFLFLSGEYSGGEILKTQAPWSAGSHPGTPTLVTLGGVP